MNSHRHNKSYFYLDMQTHELEVPYKAQKRRVRVLLPKNYDTETQHYPVVYMHDGQNVFYSREAYTGQSWKTIHTIKKNPDIPKMIIVGIDNDNDNRMNEYSAWKFKDTGMPFNIEFGGKGIEYAEFVLEVVKPFIDATYRTKPDKAHTAMIGSSLGGNISQFMGIAFQNQIGGLGIFSSAMWLTQETFNRYIDKTPLDSEQRVYIQVGTQEGDDTDATLTRGNIKQLYLDSSLTYYQQLVRGGIPMEQIHFDIVADGIHHETVWAHYLPTCLRFLSENWN